MESIIGFEDVDDFERSFSFTTTASDFNSDDEDTDGNEYIEIALDHHHHHNHEEELDCLRISFSSSSSAALPFPELIISDESETLPNPKTQHMIMTFSADSVMNEAPSSSSSSSSSSSPSSSSSWFYNTRRRRITSQLPTFGRILDSLMQLSFRVTSKGSGGRGDDENQKQRPLIIHHHADNRDLLRHTNNNRKAYSSKFKTTASTANNNNNNNNTTGIMKLFIKLRGIKIGTLIASITKPRRVGVVAVAVVPTDNNNRKTSRESTVEYYRRSLMKPLALNKWLLQRNKDQITTSIEAMSITTMINGRKENNSSPLHDHDNKGVPISGKSFSRENSIQSAIAHCKTSFATTTSSSSHDFTF